MTALLLCVAVCAQTPSDPIAALLIEMEARPWTAPQTTVPAEVVEAARSAFRHGLADPSGGTLHRVTLRSVGYLGGEQIVDAIGWVLPGLFAERRVAVLLNGMIEPVAAVGETVAAGDVVSKLVSGTHTVRFPGDFGPPPLVPEALLLRAGDVAVAEELFRLRLSTFSSKDLEESLVGAVLAAHSDRAKTAHLAGDDLASLRHSSVVERHMKAYLDLADERQLALWREYNNGPPAELDRIVELANDSRRRLSLRHNTAPTQDQIEQWVEGKRVSSLVQALEFASARQMMIPGGVAWTGDPIVRGLVRVGEEAVDELIDTYDRDTRLTRSCTSSRILFGPDRILPVKDAAFAALGAILYYPGIASSSDGRATPMELRAYWNTFRNVPIVERRYKELADEVAQPRQWLAAAQYIVEGTNVNRDAGWLSATTLPEGQAPTMKGEPLRDGRSPSVTELLSRRMGQTMGARSFRDSWDWFGLNDAVTLVKCLFTWDPMGSLPAMKGLASRFVSVAQTQSSGSEYMTSQLTQHLGSMSYVTVARTRLGDGSAAAEDYSIVALRTTRDSSFYDAAAYFAPLFLFPQEPAYRELAEKLFGSASSSWHPTKAWKGLGQSEFSTRLLLVPAYRREVLAMLKDASEIGKVEFDGSSYRYEFGKEQGSGSVGPVAEHAAATGIQKGDASVLRVCDSVAYALSLLHGAPVFSPVWDSARKDEAALAIHAFIEANAARLGELLPGDRFRQVPEWMTATPIQSGRGDRI